MSPDRRMAQQSLKEERDAIRTYAKRIQRAKDPRLVRALRHARREERQHAASFKRLAPSLGAACSRVPRLARGMGGLFLGTIAGGVLGVLVGAAVGIKKVGGDGSATAPITAGITAGVVAVAISAVTGAVVAALPDEC